MNDLTQPRLPKDAVILEENDKVLLLIPSKPDWVTVNKNAAILLSLCDGNHSISDIKNLLNDHPYKQEAFDLIEKLEQRSFFSESRRPEFKIRHLKNVHLNISDACNLKCLYCYASDRQRPGADNNGTGSHSPDSHSPDSHGNDNNSLNHKALLSLSDYHNLIDEIYDFSPNIAITITGGEPLLNKDAFKIGEYCKNKGFYVYILTNGTFIDKNNIEKVKASFDHVKISIDSWNEKIHDHLRGPGAYAKVVNSANLLEEYQVEFTVATTLTSYNLVDIQQLVDKFGAKLTFQPLFCAGDGKNIFDKYRLSGHDYYYALKSLNNVQPFSDIYGYLEQQRNNPSPRCAVGDSEISVSAYGDVYPCHMLHHKQFYSGNIKEDSFKNIYLNSSVLQDVRKLSISTREVCSACPIRFLCCGGCWARSFFEHGHLNIQDSFCDYELLAIKDALLTS
ncbi:MAG: radical SAM protein [Deltaproteobacteria bacterium]|jgi:radical SAM protein with 4Fe4S-binding SPASM domain|nr:radical SAM protein [Deltaproteobacteria bacterium]